MYRVIKKRSQAKNDVREGTKRRYESHFAGIVGRNFQVRRFLEEEISFMDDEFSKI
jgi:hypothetical protein